MSDDRVEPKTDPPRARVRSESQEIAYARALFEVRKLPHAQRLELLEDANLDRTNEIAALHHRVSAVLEPAVRTLDEKHATTLAGIVSLQAHLGRQDEAAEQSRRTWSAKDWKMILAGTAWRGTSRGAAVAAILAAGHH